MTTAADNAVIAAKDGAAPLEMRDPLVRRELKRAGVWLGLVGAIMLAVLLIQPLLVVFAAIVVATMLDGGVRLLGRALTVGRGWRLLIVVLAVIAFVAGTFYATGVEVTQQFGELRTTLEGQAMRLTTWLSGHGLMPQVSDMTGLAQQALGSVGKLTSWVGTLFGAMTTFLMIVVLGIFLAIDPTTYERGLAWFVPSRSRAEFLTTLDRIGYVQRRLLAGRLMGMAIEGALTWLLLMLGGVPMALLLGIIAGMLAFIPNIGAFITGVLMVTVGFSAGQDKAVWAAVTYVVVQAFDGYVVIPTVAKRTVNLPPALTLVAQIMAGALFGILGLALADPLTALIKTALERSAELQGEASGDKGVDQG